MAIPPRHQHSANVPMNFFKRLFSGRPRSQPQAPDAEAHMTLQQRMYQVLGHRRCRLLSCCCADYPSSPWVFRPPERSALHLAAQQYFERCLHQEQSFDDAPVRNLIRAVGAVGLLTYGRKDVLDVVVEQLPQRRVVLDHGAGYCWILPFQTTAALLPLPEPLRESRDWIRGSPTAVDLQNWLTEHGEHLVWDHATERFCLPETRGATEPAG